MARLLAVSMDVMVKDKFVKTIFVKPTKWMFTETSIVEALTMDEIDRVVAEECPYTHDHRDWHIELNDESQWKYSK